ncbi:MobA/MobL family protein [Novosphingobium sp. G106]|uniref:MobA/MobL family protein n=1 Tax=Novosphingobium sp. G106 TaxID=2849500 RepID=UPI001C2D01FE|nr:MobA/MobL family protein [Novosphingobium sp. G106]MBV1692064.1 MobA/MobL family protein [Novosphingobium sp. G106]
MRLSSLSTAVDRLIGGFEPEDVFGWWGVGNNPTSPTVNSASEASIAPRFRFHIPMRRALRLSTEDGRTSFHFSHRSVARTRMGTQVDGMDAERGAAAAHCGYIERESATVKIFSAEPEVAVSYASFEYASAEAVLKKSAVAEDMQGPARRDPNFVGDAMPRCIGRGARAATTRQLGNGDRAATEAIASHGGACILSNISEDPAERVRFWQLVEEHEALPAADMMSLDIQRAPAFWASVMVHPKCPVELRTALETETAHRKFVISSGRKVRAFLSSLDGWSGNRKKRVGETQEGYRLSKDSFAKFHDGRGGRIQSRVIAELPNELSPAGRLGVMRSFCREFERNGLPFNAALHAPDHANDERQWHFHLDYYDRPCRRLTSIDFEKARELGYVSAEAVAGDWDFAARFCSDQRRKSSRLFRQDKVRDVRRKDWIGYLRGRFAAQVNEALTREGHERRYDPRTYEQMGIAAKPGEHLGTKLSAAEGKGKVSIVGVRNERKQWEVIVQQLDDQLIDGHRRRILAIQRRRRELEEASLRPSLSEPIEDRIRLLDDAWERLIDAEDVGERVHQLTARVCSRAAYIERINDRWLAAHNAGACSLSPAQQKEREALRTAARDHLERLRPLRAESAEIVEMSSATCLAARAQMSECERVVDDHFKAAVNQQASERIAQIPQMASEQEKAAGPVKALGEPASATQQPSAAKRSEAATAASPVAPARQAVEQAPIDQRPTTAPTSEVGPASNDAAKGAVRRLSVVDRLTNEGLRIRLVEGRIRFSDLARRQLDVRQEDAADKHFVQRLQDIARMQDRELTRLSAHATAQPDRVRIDEAAGEFSLSRRTPEELVALDRKWRGEPEYQHELKRIFDNYQKRLAAAQAAAAEADAIRKREVEAARRRDEAQRAAARVAQARQDEIDERERQRQERLQRFKKGVPILIDPEEAAIGRAAAQREEQKRRELEKRSIRLRPEQIAALDSVNMRAAIDKANERPRSGLNAQGRHPLIDRWLEALDKRMDTHEREARAAQIVNDAEAFAELAAIDRTTAERIREDARRRAEQSRNSNSLWRSRGF